MFTYSNYRNDNLPDLKMQFDVFLRFFIKPDQVWNFFAWLSCQTCGIYLYMHTFQSNEFALNW